LINVDYIIGLNCPYVPQCGKCSYFFMSCVMGCIITLVDLQIDAQNSCLFTYNTRIKILYMFRALPCSSSGGLRHNCIYAAFGIDTRGCIYTIMTWTSWRWAG